MLKLNSNIVLDRKAIKATNLCDRFDDADLKRIGDWCFDGYTRDKQSRYNWERRTEAAMDLALQISKGKNFPWPNCSNIAFPLVTIATLQFHSRAYPAIISGTDVVKMRVIGTDATGEKQLRADRVSTHMSYQVLEEDKAWEEQHDRLLINLPCVGTAFTKSYYKPSKGHNVSELVLAKDLVLDYWSKSVEESPRKTHIIPLFRNEIHEKVLRGTFRDVLEDGWYKSPPVIAVTQQAQGKDNRQGLTPPLADETTAFTCLEQHCELDLDGDGYAEPYVITLEETSHTVLRIVTGFDREEDIERVQEGSKKGQIISITALQYFTKYSFIPSPDGGIYDVGFGILLGPLNEATNSLINQLVDAGTMSNAAGGFLGRGAKIRGGQYTFAPLEWKRVDSTGDDLRKSIFPLPVREPSNVLFQLLTMLVEYTNRVSGSTDAMVGINPGQNQPAETTRTVVEQGTKIYSAIFKRVWRSMKEEFKKLYILNGMNLPITSNFGDGKKALKEDYLGNPDDICPAADPNVTSDQMAMLQAQALKQAAMSTPGYDPEEVERRYLRVLKIENIDKVYPGPKAMPPGKDIKLQIAELKAQTAQATIQSNQAMFAAELMEDQRMNGAEIAKIQAQIIEIRENLSGEAMNRQLNYMNTMLGFMKRRDESLSKRIELILKTLEIHHAAKESGHGGIPGLVRASGNGEDKTATAIQAAGAEGPMGTGIAQ